MSKVTVLGMEIQGKKGWGVKSGDFYVKDIHPHVVFTTNSGDSYLCFTKVEAEAVKEFIEGHFAF